MPLPSEIAQYPIARHLLQKRRGRFKPRRWAWNVTRLEEPWNTLGKPHLLLPFWESFGTTYRDYSGNSRPITVAGVAPTWETGEMGPCIKFRDVDGDWLEVGGTAALTWPTEWTLLFWFSVRDADIAIGTLTQYMFAHGTTQQPNSIDVYVREKGTGTVNPGAISISCIDSVGDATTTISIPAGLADDRWHCFALKASPREAWRAYVDGVLRTSETLRGRDPFTPPGNMRIGNTQDGSATRPFSGKLANMTIFSRSLPDQMIRQAFEDPWVWLRPKRGLAINFTPPVSQGSGGQILPEELGPQPSDSF